MQNKTALIAGITGQDGAYLSKLLIDKQYQVIGVVRQNDDFSRLEYLNIRDKITFVTCDLLQLTEVKHVLKLYKPCEVYNFAAQSSVTLSIKEPYQTLNFNIMSVVNLLEAIRLVDYSIKFFQASSCEMFGAAEILPTNEMTPFKPLNPYAVSKVSAHLIVVNYRKAFNLFACNGILFHHESYVRQPDFFVKKVIRQALEIQCGMRDVLTVGNLDVARDFGYAPDYVQAMWLMLQHSMPDDYVVASNQSVLLRDIVYYVFDRLGISRDKIVHDDRLLRAAEIKKTLGDNTKIKTTLKWEYNRSFYHVLDILLEEEAKNFK
jgi:GDPmannose 4,6-dehydratase